MKILIVDDAMFMRRMLTKIFEKGGHEICGTAVNGAEAIEKYRELMPDLVTMDIIMPDMSGVDAVKGIKSFDPEAKILMITAMGQKEVINGMMQEGTVDYIVKPFQPERILESIKRMAPQAKQSS